VCGIVNGVNSNAPNFVQQLEQNTLVNYMYLFQRLTFNIMKSYDLLCTKSKFRFRNKYKTRFINYAGILYFYKKCVNFIIKICTFLIQEYSRQSVVFT